MTSLRKPRTLNTAYRGTSRNRVEDRLHVGGVITKTEMTSRDTDARVGPKGREHVAPSPKRRRRVRKRPLQNGYDDYDVRAALRTGRSENGDGPLPPGPRRGAR